MFVKRVTVIVGHFGSGKTEIAINGALQLADAGVPVALVDLDVVKPYFRSRAARAVMAEHGVDLVVPGGDNVFADLPIIVPQVRALLRDSRRKVLFDVGGDDTGARALGSLADVVPVAETEHLLGLEEGALAGPAAQWLDLLHPADRDRSGASCNKHRCNPGTEQRRAKGACFDPRRG